MATNPRIVSSDELLPKILEEVRAGRFRPELRSDAEFVYANCEDFRIRGDEVSVGRAHSLLWEIYDQAGLYRSGIDVIRPLSENYLNDLRNTEFPTSRLEQMGEETLKKQRRVVRQKVMCCLAYGFALYRCQRHETAKSVLDVCESFLTHTFSDENSQYPWGTMARLHYFYGQVLRAARVEPNLTQARERFNKALDCVWRRLDQTKTRSLPRHKLEVEHLFAKHCAAKVLAFGFGWTSLLQGELAKAQEFIQSARVLLNDSQDRFLLWQLELFYCNVQRARKEEPRNYPKLLQRMRECSSALKDHPEYYLQSLRHLAVAHFNLAQAKRTTNRTESDRYFTEGKKLVEEGLPLSRDNREYEVTGIILASRFAGAGRLPNQAESLRLAKEAYGKARDENLPAPVVAEAAIAYAEALCRERARSDWRRGIELLKEAREKGGVVPRCAAHLHLADLYFKLNEVSNAGLSFASWEKESKTVEHEWLRQKAESLEQSISASRLFWVDAEDKRNYKDLRRDLQHFLVDREKLRQQNQEGENGFDECEAAKNIGIDPDTLKNWQEGWMGKKRQK
jgi:hypothetical protein